MAEDRVKALGERFKKRPAMPDQVMRERRTYYLDADLISEIDQVHRKLNYEKGGVSKSAFLEALLKYGLHNISSVEKALVGDDAVT
jgi:hypothetical protein